MKRTNRSAKALVNTEELGRAVRRRREELGLSLRDVAVKTSVSASTLSRIENGTGKPDADNIARLTAWLDVPMERILSGRDPQAESSQAVVYYPQEPTPEIVEAHRERIRQGQQRGASQVARRPQRRRPRTLQDVA